MYKIFRLLALSRAHQLQFDRISSPMKLVLEFIDLLIKQDLKFTEFPSTLYSKMIHVSGNVVSSCSNSWLSD